MNGTKMTGEGAGGRGGDKKQTRSKSVLAAATKHSGNHAETTAPRARHARGAAAGTTASPPPGESDRFTVGEDGADALVDSDLHVRPDKPINPCSFFLKI